MGHQAHANIIESWGSTRSGLHRHYVKSYSQGRCVLFLQVLDIRAMIPLDLE